ncbi:MAG: hypothetical protein KC619_31555 [Myxococcales bacterium]|nr:hypothetical protein [Myxococcales bacterium]
MRSLIVASCCLLAACTDPAVHDLDASLEDAGVDSGLAMAPDAGVDAGPPLPDPPPTLSATGLFTSGASGPYAAGAREYAVRHPLWTDGAEKRRHLLLPPGAAIDTTDPDHWAFPEGTRIFKEFLVDGRPIETRMLWKTGPGVGSWVYVAYRYREDGSDADAVPDGEADVLGTPHDVPSTDDCRNCHRGGRDFVLGLGAMQLERATFDAWMSEGVLPPATSYGAPPGDDVARTALGYLHGNCGHCHNDVHPLARNRALRLFLPVGVVDPWTAPAWVTGANATANHDIGGATAIIEVGDPAASQLWVRMGLRDDLAMPPLGTEIVDDAARDAIAAWIASGAP